MSIQDKFDSVRALLAIHNNAFSDAEAGKVDIDLFFSRLKIIGGTSDDRLKSLSYEDILDCFAGDFKPKLLAKDIAKIFRDKPAEERPVSSKKAETMTKRELVEAFSPEDFTNSVGKILSVMCKNKAFIVYTTGRTVDVERTLSLLEEVRQGYPARTDVSVNGIVKKVYSIGELPENYVDENPLYPGRPLRPDGTCDQTGRSWNGVPLDVRQFIRVALSEFTMSIDKANDLLDAALSEGALEKLSNKYRKSSLKFTELQETNKLPSLKISLNKTFGEPFAGGQKITIK